MHPRLDISFNAREACQSLKCLFNVPPSRTVMNDLFPGAAVFYYNHARSALADYLEFLHLKPGSRVGVQILNCVTVFQSIVNAGYKPCFLDICDDFTLDTGDLGKKKDKLAALIVTHTFGNPAAIDEIMRITPELPIIEDCSHAFLTTVNGKTAGSIGRAAIFSHGLGKFPSIGDGGFLVLNDKKEFERFTTHYQSLACPGKLAAGKIWSANALVRIMHHPCLYPLTAAAKRMRKRLNGSSYNYSYKRSKGYGHNLAMFNFIARKASLARDLQVRNCKLILSSMGEKKNVKYKLGSNGFMCPVLVQNSEKVEKALYSIGIDIASHFSDSIAIACFFGYQKGDCGNAEKKTGHYLTIPTYSTYPRRVLQEVISSIKADW